MNTRAQILDGPLSAAGHWHMAGAGAVICFEGVVRPIENDQLITGLRYETYDPMALKQLQQLANDAMGRFDILAVCVEHSRGFVANDQCSFRLRIAAPHRKQALAAMDWYIDQMKQVVPIWKHPVPADPSQETTP